MNRVLELFGKPTSELGCNWREISGDQQCPFVGRKCIKVRKSQPTVAIGTCCVLYGHDETPIVICPLRLLERRQVVSDCIHLLTLHEPGNELHLVPEVSIPGGSVDYFLVSVNDGKVVDFVGIELQTLDTTGTVFPERQRFLKSVGLRVRGSDVRSTKGFGMNWKMTAKTILVQLHHKTETFEHISKHLVLMVQDRLLAYMRREFQFEHLHQARLGDPAQIHSYRSLRQTSGEYCLKLDARLSTDSGGVARCLGLQAETKVELEDIIRTLQAKISKKTQFSPLRDSGRPARCR
jgi:hypothetical protein